MSTQSATRPDAGAVSDAEPASAVQHHPQPAPDEHLCACGRLRADCVREAVRGLWSERAD
jgi:hypothetical protein